MTSSMTSWRWRLVSALGTCSALARQARDLSTSVRVSAWTDTGDYWNLLWCVAAHGWSFGPEIFRFCRSRHAGSSGGFRFLNWWPNLHKSEGGGHDFRSLWWHVEEHGLASGPEIFRFGRSWADEFSGGIGFVKFFQDLRRFEWEIRGSLGICGRAWQRVMAPLCTLFSGFCYSKSLEDFCGLIFCEILSEILEIWKRRWQALLNLLPF